MPDCFCIRCDKKMQNLQDPNEGLQPLGGIAFKTPGHYGSAYFDPMGREILEIAVCDACTEMAEDRGIVFRGERITTTTTSRVEKPKKHLDEPPSDT